MKIMFWSLYHGQTATTSNMAAIASNIALKSDYKGIVLHNQLTHNLIERYLNVDNNLFERNSKGLDPVVTQLKNINLRAEEIPQYCVSTLNDDRLDVLMGSSHDEDSVYNEFDSLFKGVVELSDKYYDLVYIDACTGESPVVTDLMENVDCIIINVNQNKYVLEDTEAYYNNLGDIKKKVIIGVSNYNPENKLTVKNIQRKYGFKNVVAIPYSVDFGNSINNDSLMEFLHINTNATEQDSAYDFISRLNEISNRILDMGCKQVIKA